MSQSDPKDLSLAPDTQFEELLARVAYQPGMLLGLEATRAEQDYHRRRLTRHAYWMHGSGTACGLRVLARGDDPGDADTQVLVRLFVAPGIAVDGLGREVTVAEPHCIDLTAWLATQQADEELWGALVRDGYDEPKNTLWLKVTLRYRDCESGLQPVLATGVNAGTDPVQASRVRDGAYLELVPECPADAPTGDHPFAAHGALPDLAGLLADGRLGTAEQKRLEDATGVAQDQLELGARLLFALTEDNHALEARELDAAALARILLARVSIQLAPERTLIVNPRRVEVDNLARPFLFSPGLLAALARAGGE